MKSKFFIILLAGLILSACGSQPSGGADAATEQYIQAMADKDKAQCSCEDGDNTLVNCTGTLDLTYNDEIRAIDLSLRTYYLQEVDGQWKVCEYR